MKSILIAILIVSLIVAGLYGYRHFSKNATESKPVEEPIMPSDVMVGEDYQAPPSIPVGTGSDAADEEPESQEAAPTTMAETDGYLRRSLGADEAATPPLLGTILQSDNLLYKLAAATDLISRGKNPFSQLQFLKPATPVVTVQRDEHLYLAAEGYARYEPLVSLLASHDSRRIVHAYRLLRPFLAAAYDELGNEGVHWSETEAAVLNLIIKAPLPEAEPELIGDGDVFIFADPGLEELGFTEKAMIRMGPENVRRIQNKLSEIKLLLGEP